MCSLKDDCSDSSLNAIHINIPISVIMTLITKQHNKFINVNFLLRKKWHWWKLSVATTVHVEEDKPSTVTKKNLYRLTRETRIWKRWEAVLLFFMKVSFFPLFTTEPVNVVVTQGIRVMAPSGKLIILGMTIRITVSWWRSNFCQCWCWYWWRQWKWRSWSWSWLRGRWWRRRCWWWRWGWWF